VERFSVDDLCQLNYLSDKALAFDVPESYKKRLHEVIVELEKKDSILESIYRLRLVTHEEMLKNFSENEVEFTPDEY
jgi:hypothetical protein